MKTAIVIFAIILLCCGLVCVLDSDNLFKSAPTYIKNKSTNTDTIKLKDAMFYFQQGYYFGGDRAVNGDNLDEHWKADSVYFVKRFFTPIK